MAIVMGLFRIAICPHRRSAGHTWTNDCRAGFSGCVFFGLHMSGTVVPTFVLLAQAQSPLTRVQLLPRELGKT
jgi:hypothetical protein